MSLRCRDAIDIIDTFQISMQFSLFRFFSLPLRRFFLFSSTRRSRFFGHFHWYFRRFCSFLFQLFFFSTSNVLASFGFFFVRLFYCELLFFLRHVLIGAYFYTHRNTLNRSLRCGCMFMRAFSSVLALPKCDVKPKSGPVESKCKAKNYTAQHQCNDLHDIIIFYLFFSFDSVQQRTKVQINDLASSVPQKNHGTNTE